MTLSEHQSLGDAAANRASLLRSTRVYRCDRCDDVVMHGDGSGYCDAHELVLCGSCAERHSREHGSGRGRW